MVPVTTFHPARRRARLLLVLVLAALLGLGTGPAFAGPTGDPAHPEELVGFGLDDPRLEKYQPPILDFPSADHVLTLGPPPDPTTDPVRAAEFDDYLEALGSRKQYPKGSEAHFWAAWRDYKATHPNADFVLWRSRYRTVTNNRELGKGSKGFEQFVRGHAPQFEDETGWEFDRTVRKSGSKKRPDAQNPAKYYWVEFKSGGLDERSEKQIAEFIKNAHAQGKMLQIVFLEPPTAKDLERLRRIQEGAPQNQGRAKNDLVKAFELRLFPATVVRSKPESTGAPAMPAFLRASPTAAATPDATGGAGNKPGGGPAPKPGGGGGGAAPAVAGPPLATGAQHAVSGGLATAVDRSADNATIARMERQIELDILAQYAEEFGEEFDPTLDAPQELGGVDFSTLELRYVSDAYQGHAAQFAFNADAAPADQPAYGGRRAAQLASDSFFVWLALPPSAFTVNLNPDEPNRIIDASFGRTDAGRVLLEADLRMKKSVAAFINPDTPKGKQFWDGLRGAEKCLSMRQWIVPGTATVRETGNELYILEAPLQVKMETDYVAAAGAANYGGCDKDKAAAAYNEQLYRTTILPQVQKAVNEAPEYEDLRRVYFSRVAAQWYRQREDKKRTAYSAVINSGDLGPWVSRESWSPKEVFDRFVKSYTEGEFKKEYTQRDGNTIYTYTYVYGGVDFTSVKERDVGAGPFATQRPGLPRTVSVSRYGLTTDTAGKEVWLGGLTADRPIQDLPMRPPARGPSQTSFYVLTGLPIVAWLAVGGWLLLRRLRRSPGGVR